MDVTISLCALGMYRTMVYPVFVILYIDIRPYWVPVTIKIYYIDGDYLCLLCFDRVWAESDGGDNEEVERRNSKAVMRSG